MIGKVFTEPRRARLLHEHLRLLCAGPFAGGEPAASPSLSASSAERALVLVPHGVPVTPWTRSATRRRPPAGVRSPPAGWPDCTPATSSCRGALLLDQEAETTHEWARMVGRCTTRIAARARRLAERMAAWPGVHRAFDRNRPIHKDFHAGHVLVGRRTCA